VLTTLCAALSCAEVVTILRRAELPPFRRVLWPSILALVWLHWLPAAPVLGPWVGAQSSHRWLLVLVIFGCSAVAALLAGVWGFREGGPAALRRTGGTLLGVVYLGGGATALVATRWLPDGLAAVLLLVLATKAADSGAYFTGRWLGRRPLAPALSPQKTIEGAVGAVLWGAVAAAGLALVVQSLDTGWWLSIGWSLAVGAVLGAWGQLGDLVESWLKRAAAMKDSSAWLPGLGGMLDVLDSLLWNAPLFALWWSLSAP